MFLHILPYVSTIYSLGLTNRVTPTSLISELHKGSSQPRNATGRNVKQVFVVLSLATWGAQQLSPAAPAQPASCGHTRALRTAAVSPTPARPVPASERPLPRNCPRSRVIIPGLEYCHVVPGFKPQLSSHQALQVHTCLHEGFGSFPTATFISAFLFHFFLKELRILNTNQFWAGDGWRKTVTFAFILVLNSGRLAL